MRCALFLAGLLLVGLAAEADAKANSRIAAAVRAKKYKNLKASSELMRFAARAELETQQSMLAKEEYKPCGNCVYVMERIKNGYQGVIPSICVEVFQQTKSQEEFGICHNVVASLSPHGPLIRQWLHVGCYKQEPYGAMSLITPCPSHVICSHLQNLQGRPFCKAPESDYVNEEGTAPDGSGSGGSGSGGGSSKSKKK